MSDELPFLPFHAPAWWTAWTSGAALPAPVVWDEPPPMSPGWRWDAPDQSGPPEGWAAS